PAFGGAAAPKLSPDGRWVLYVHSDGGRDALCVVPADGSQYPQKLLDDTDFVMHPAWSPDGTHTACITWDHPHMPWDATTLHLLSLDTDNGLPRVTERRMIAGDRTKEAIFGAAFSPDGTRLAYASDRSGWWGLYTHHLASGDEAHLTPGSAEYALPAWLQEMRTFAWSPDGDALYALRTADTHYTLVRVDVTTGGVETVTGLEAYTHLEQLAVCATTGAVAVMAGATHLPDRLVSIQPGEAGAFVGRHSDLGTIPADYLAHGQVITWDSDGVEISGLYYPPTNPRYESGGVPPLVVHVHSGPTRQRFAKFFSEVHFFTTRGYAVLDPNYRGSTGYGRAFKDALYGAWGVAEVDDAVRGAQALVERGLADGDRLVVFGESSGGYSVLQSLIRYPGTYRAGIAQAPVSDHFALAAHTHKFERYYNDMLLGPLPAAAELYRELSPALNAGAIQDPLALFHGEDDSVVPIGPSATVAGALRRSGVPHVYRAYPGEGHSFRAPDTVRDYMTTTLAFLTAHVIYGS
ncbi:MAG: prolyl oligopeptidase family serine peptidase, partial [Chloroflexota bacterium]